GDVEPAVLGQEALVQGCIGLPVAERMFKVTQRRRRQEEHGDRGYAQAHAGLELLDACKLERSPKRLFDPRTSDIYAVDFVQQQMDHVAERHKATYEPRRNRGEAKEVICGGGASEQEEDGGKLRMKNASVHGEFGEDLVESVADKEMDHDPQD